jgi:hypothetical protein
LQQHQPLHSAVLTFYPPSFIGFPVLPNISGVLTFQHAMHFSGSSLPHRRNSPRDVWSSLTLR